MHEDKTTRSTHFGKGVTELCAYAAEGCSFESCKIIPRERTIYKPRDIFGINNGPDIKVSSTLFRTSEVFCYRAKATKQLSFSSKTSRCIQTSALSRSFGDGNLANGAMERLPARTYALPGFICHPLLGPLYNIFTVLSDRLEYCVLSHSTYTLG